MTGDAPQPGETPRTEGNPWSFDPDATWWRGDGDREQAEALAEAAARPRHPRRRPAPTAPAPAATADLAPGPGADNPFLAEAVDAHASGVQDAAGALDTPAEAGPDRAERTGNAAPTADAKPGQPEPVAVERDHDVTTTSRYTPIEPPGEADADVAHWSDDAPELMVLPEPQPSRERTTVPLEPGPVPGRPQEPDPTHHPRTPAAELDVKRSRMENSPFWLTDEERAAADNAKADARDTGAGTDRTTGDVRRDRAARSRTPHHAGRSLLGLVVIALVAAFFSWVSAEPFWLAVGHGRAGTATVVRCTGSGVTQRCAGTFTASEGGRAAKNVTLLGVDPAGRSPGAVAPARMVGAGSTQAYVGATGTLVHLRWMLGFLLVLLCGLGIAALTGTRQLETARARRGALLMCLAGPLMLLAGFLLATY